MTQTSVIIHGVIAGMTAGQVKQKLACLYKRPEEKFEVVSRSLFVKNQPYLFIKGIEQATAELHKKRLTEHGFICEEETFAQDESELSLKPVDAIKAADVECPACKQPSGGGDICNHCEVVISKYIEHKTFDDQLQSQLKSSSYSHERMQEIRVEKLERESSDEQTKKLNKVAGKKKNDSASHESGVSAATSTTVENRISVDSDEKTSKKLYAVIASVFLTIVGAGIIASQLVDNPFSKNEILAKQNSEDSVGPMGEFDNLAAIDPSNEELIETVPETVFDFQIVHQRELKKIEKKIGRLFDEDMVFSITHLIASKEDPREKIFAKQALVKIEEFDQETIGKLEGIHAMLGDLDKDFDRVQMLINHAAIYKKFELPTESSELIEQARSIASDIETTEDQMMTKIAFAEYQLQYGDVEEAMALYQQVKTLSSELSLESLEDSVYRYIAMSEASHGLSIQAQSTSELIAASSIRENALLQISKLADKADKAKTADSPDLAAAQPSTEIGDPLIDDLIEMTKQNQQTLKAASGLLGQ